jgi:phosphoribosyl 1,2-cyclic phosphodiesterase
MRVKLWGVRGSLPAPITPDVLRWRMEEVLTQYQRLRDANVVVSARAFLETLPAHLVRGFGGNTSCAEVTMGKSRLLIDGGSGIRAFSEHIMQVEPTTSEFHIYQTHFHWDHLIGLPFFTPIYMKGKTIHFYSVDDELERSLRTLFRKPNFPVPYEIISQQIKLHKIEPRKPFQINDLTLTPYQLDHPDPCWGVRVEAGGKSLAWAVDTECTRIHREALGEDVRLYQNADLMVFDAQYTFEEAIEKSNWGHASGPIGLDLCMREGVKHAVFVHHDPAASDEVIRQAEEQTQVYYNELVRQNQRIGRPPVELRWHFGREGEVFEL